MDPIANMISSINNAQSNKKQYLVIPFSNLKLRILGKLKQKQYILDCQELKNKKHKLIKIILSYINSKKRISHLKRLSKPSLRRYVNHKQIPRVLGGIGDTIISTPKGVLTGKEARKKNLGGELICEVY